MAKSVRGYFVTCVCPAGEGSRAGMVSGGLWLWFVPAGEWGRGGCVRGGVVFWFVPAGEGGRGGLCS